MSYSAALESMARTPVTLVVLTLDFCGRTFGASPCLATGAPCHNTYKTCKYKGAWLRQSKDYKFSSADAPLPFKSGERPYLQAVNYLPTEIRDNLTVNGRLTAVFHDEPDSDVGIDPYVAQRPAAQGTFWKKLLSRNPNYKGRQIKIYEGFAGLAEGDYQQRWAGVLDNIRLDGDSIKAEAVDLLKSLADVEAPPKLDIKLVADINAVAAAITLTTVSGLDSPSGYVRLKDEIIYYTGRNTGTNQITGCQRGFFGTTASTHKANDKVQKVRYYAPANPFNHLKTMLLTDAGIGASYVDTAAFDYWRDWPGGEVDFSAIVSEPTKLDKLYFEVIDLVDAKSWVGEDLKITIRRNVPNEPGRAYHTITDEANIIHDSAAVDLNEKSRLTRMSIYWDRAAVSRADDSAAYARLDVAVDADAEGANEYNETIEKKAYCRWLRSGYMQEEPMQTYIKNLLARRLFRQRDAQPILDLDVELKDSGIKTGAYCRVSTDELANADGSPIAGQIFQTIKRAGKGHRLELSLLRLPPEKWGFIAPNDTPAYDAATEAQQEYGFITDSSGLINDRPGYYIW